MSLKLAKEYLEGKVSTTIAVILINILLLIAVIGKFNHFENDTELRLRAVEDFILIHEALEVHNDKHKTD